VSPALWGGCAALSWGIADFAARFTGRAMGATSALFGMLLTGSAVLSLWVWVGGLPVAVPGPAPLLVLMTGLGVVAGTWFLYLGYIRGPVSVVSPIVAGYPALVLIVAIVLGARPSAVEWAAMAAVFAGVYLVARGARRFAHLEAYAPGVLGRTILIAAASAIGFAVAIAAGQHAVPLYGDIQTLWLSRLVSLAVLSGLFLIPGQRLSVSFRWLPLIALQGLLDAGGYLAVFAAAADPDAHLAAVVGAGFAIVTTLLARLFLREPIAPMQWTGIALTVGGSALLAS